MAATTGWARVRGARWAAAGLVLVLAAGVLAGCRKTAAWSPDGKQITVEAYGGIQVHDVRSGDFRKLVAGEAGKHEALAPAWSPDSRSVVFFDARAERDQVTASLVAVDAGTGKQTPVVASIPATGEEPNGDDPIGPVRDWCAAAWSPDGREIAYVTPERGRPVVWVVAASGGEPRRITPAGRQATWPAWSPDSRWIACAAAAAEEGAAWEIELMERDGSGRRTLGQAPAGMEVASGPQWSPDGKSAGVFFSRSGGGEQDPPACEAWSISAPDGALRKIADVPGPAWSASFTRDLRSVLFLRDVDQGAGRKTATVALLEAPYERPRVLAHPSVYESPSITIPAASPDGQAVAVQVQDGENLLVLGLRFLDGRPAVDLTVPK